MNTLLQGPRLLENFGRDKLCVICMCLCISHKYNIIVCVLTTPPFSQSTVVLPFCKNGKMGVKLWKLYILEMYKLQVNLLNFSLF